MSKAYLISEKRMHEDILDSIAYMEENFNNFFVLEMEEVEKGVYDDTLANEDDIPDHITIVKDALEELEHFKELLLTLPIVETVVLPKYTNRE